MLNFMKYIVVEVKGSFEVAFLFPEIMIHDEFYHMIKSKIPGWDPKITSAGFVKYTDDEIICCGRSISLNLHSRGKTDADIIRRNLGKENE